jgi:hypothetical protein
MKGCAREKVLPVAGRHDFDSFYHLWCEWKWLAVEIIQLMKLKVGKRTCSSKYDLYDVTKNSQDD